MALAEVRVITEWIFEDLELYFHSMYSRYMVHVYCVRWIVRKNQCEWEWVNWIEIEIEIEIVPLKISFLLVILFSLEKIVYPILVTHLHDLVRRIVTDRRRCTTIEYTNSIPEVEALRYVRHCSTHECSMHEKYLTVPRSWHLIPQYLQILASNVYTLWTFDTGHQRSFTICDAFGLFCCWQTSYECGRK